MIVFGGFMTVSEEKKSVLQRLTVAALPKETPDLNAVDATKDNIIASWIQEWITTDLKAGRIKTQNLLPQKADIAKYLGVSVGTVQNAIRYVEDNGYVESKQRIGTMIKDLNDSTSQVRKQTSKRDKVITSIKKLILQEQYKIIEALPHRQGSCQRC
jgi:DNA-binding GntR family transcriptional regulator